MLRLNIMASTREGVPTACSVIFNNNLSADEIRADMEALIAEMRRRMEAKLAVAQHIRTVVETTVEQLECDT